MELLSGYRLPYDPFIFLAKLKSNRDKYLNELWENLYHQGDVDTASYAAVPKLVELGELFLVGAIEVARQSEHNPPIPDDLSNNYHTALKLALSEIPTDQEQLQGYYVIHASLNNQFELAKAISLLSINEMLDE